VQEPLLLKLPLPLLPNATVPAGVVAVPPDCESVTVAVQVVPLPYVTGFGVHETLVDVEREVMLKGLLVAEVSPELVAVTV
jgi:hypothetical protein